MNETLAIWWSGVSASASAAFLPLTGHIDAVTGLAALGVVCLVAGVVLALRWREVQALWMLPLAVMASLCPVVVSLATDKLGSLGGGFALVAGGFLLILAISLIANDATHRRPVWLLGAFVCILAATSGLLGLDFTAVQ